MHNKIHNKIQRNRTQYEAKVRYSRHLGGRHGGPMGGAMGENLDGTLKWRITQGSRMSLNRFLHSTPIARPSDALSGQWWLFMVVHGW